MEVRNRFKGLELIHRVPDELWKELCDIVQETGIKIIPIERNAKRQNGCLRRPYKTCEKGNEKQSTKGKIFYLNAKFQRIARRDKKVFLSN